MMDMKSILIKALMYYIINFPQCVTRLIIIVLLLQQKMKL